MSNGLAQLYEHFVPGYREGLARDDGFTPLLTPEWLQKIREERKDDPQGVLERAQRTISGVETNEDLDRVLDHFDWVFKNPEDAVRADATERGGSLPPNFKFDGMEEGSSFRHDLGSKKFSDSDVTGFGLNSGTQLIKRFFTGRVPFRWHDTHTSKFEYSLVPNANVALFADFGTGLAHSFYIAKFIAAANPDVACHLGDVYYSGKTPEVAAYYDMPLFPLVSRHELWSTPGNHDYFSGGAPYFNDLDERLNGIYGGKKHRQEGSYFCLDSPSFRIIGIDSEYHSGTRYTNEKLAHWLAEKAAEAKTKARTVILLSSDEPYTHGASHELDLLHDVTKNLAPNAIDLWFWGNTHYCALFKPSSKLRPQFYGSCIGHGGYQYKQLRSTGSATDVAEVLWAETETRFPAWTGVRPDMGNNGFCMMKLDDAERTVTLTYKDWTNAPRATVQFTPVDKRLHATSVTPHPRPLCQ